MSAEPLIFCLLPCFSDFIHAGDSVPLWAWLVKLLLTIVTIDVYASAKYLYIPRLIIDTPAKFRLNIAAGKLNITSIS